MRSIKIKVKTLLIMGCILIVFFAFADDVYFSGIRFYNNLVSENKAIDLYALNTSTLKGEAKRLKTILEDGHFSLYNLVTIGDGMTLSSARIRDFDAQMILKNYDAYKHLEDLIESMPDYVLNVVLIQWFSGNVEEAIEILNTLDVETLSLQDRDHYYLIQSAIALTYYDLNRLEDELGQISSNYGDVVNQIKQYVHLIYGYEMSYDPGFESYYDAKDPYKKFCESLADINFILLNESDTFYEQSTNDTPIEGYVTIDGEPLEGAFVYLTFGSGFSTSEGFRSLRVVTDEKGFYRFDSAYKNVRNVNVMVPWQVIASCQLTQARYTNFTKESQVDFEFKAGIGWEYAYFLDGQFHYKINDREDRENYLVRVSWFRTQIGNDQSYFYLKGREGLVDLDDIQKKMRASITHVSSEDPLALDNLMEHLYLNGDYIFSIYPIVEDQDIYVINGFFSDKLSEVITFDLGSDYNEGDLLLKNKEFEKAMDWYKNQPSRHNLSVLVNLYRYGNAYGKKSEFIQHLEGVDYDQAAFYLSELIALDGATTGRLMDLAELYKNSYDFDQAYEVLKKVDALEPPIYYTYEMAINMFHRGDYDGGASLILNQEKPISESDRYMQFFILADDIRGLSEEVKGLYDQIVVDSEYSHFTTLMRSGENQKAYAWLLNQPDSEMKTFYTLLFLDCYDYENMVWPFEKGDDINEQADLFISFYVEEVEKMHDHKLKAILKELKKYNNWFRD